MNSLEPGVEDSRQLSDRRNKREPLLIISITIIVVVVGVVIVVVVAIISFLARGRNDSSVS